MKEIEILRFKKHKNKNKQRVRKQAENGYYEIAS